MRKLYEAASFINDYIESFGLKINPSSRIGQMHRFFCSADGGPASPIGKDDPKLDQALESMRDARQLEFIFDYLNVTTDMKDLRTRLKILLKDSVLPQDDKMKSKGRDRQTEFYVYAVCSKAGLEPVFNEQPDIRVKLKNGIFGLAVKRVKSSSNLVENVRGAADQVQRSDLPGFTILDSSLAFNPDNDLVGKQMSDEIFHKRYDTVLRMMIYGNEGDEEKMRETSRPKGVRAIIFHDHQIRLHPTHGWDLASLTMMFDTTRPNCSNQRRQRELNEFWSRYKKGLPT